MTPFTQAKNLVPLFEQIFGYSASYPDILYALKNQAGHIKRSFLYRQANQVSRAFCQLA